MNNNNMITTTNNKNNIVTTNDVLYQNNNKLNDLCKLNDSSNKIINSTCICDCCFFWSDGKIVMINPCEHLIHHNCLKNKKICPHCKIKIESITNLHDYKKNPKLYQKCVDILSVTNHNNYNKLIYFDSLSNVPILTSLVGRIMITNNQKDAYILLTDFFKFINLNIKVDGLENIQSGPKVFIVNHTNFLDVMVIYYILKTSFVSSSFVNKHPITSKFQNILPLCFITVGESNNSVSQIKKYVEKNGSICIFPEGMFSHPATLTKFRTGAFHVGYPVYPIILKYKHHLCDTDYFNFLLKTSSSRKNEEVNMKILSPFYQPFDDNKIELVRKNMALHGNLLLSRTSNRDVNNKKR
jgi:1-acyl-sn-glycerol-3-phosphate acyltransferase